MTTIRELNLLPVWVNPDHLASTALHIMAGHGLRLLGVRDGQDFIGVVPLERLVSLRPIDLVSTAMMPPAHVIQGTDAVRAVAALFVRENLEFAPVVQDNRFLGILTATMLLRELGRSYDPLTTLSWSDRLREWALDNLKNGREITIIFIDLDDFGQYNKRFGHIVGDKVIQMVAEMLQSSIDPETELLVRYAGDEFAVGTLRLRDEAEALADEIRSKMGTMFIGESEEPITFSVGLHGGRRTKERENTHYAATVDNLINIASKNCLAEKVRRKSQAANPTIPADAGKAADTPSSEEEMEPRMRVAGVYADESQPNAVTTVILHSGSLVVSGTDPRGGKEVLASVAHATARALHRANPAIQLTLDAVLQTEDLSGAKVVRVVGTFQHNDISKPVAANRRISTDPLVAAAEATVDVWKSGHRENPEVV
jgi:IMP dehydrogenase